MEDQSRLETLSNAAWNLAAWAASPYALAPYLITVCSNPDLARRINNLEEDPRIVQIGRGVGSGLAGAQAIFYLSPIGLSMAPVILSLNVAGGALALGARIIKEIVDEDTPKLYDLIREGVEDFVYGIKNRQYELSDTHIGKHEPWMKK